MCDNPHFLAALAFGYMMGAGFTMLIIVIYLTGRSLK